MKILFLFLFSTSFFSKAYCQNGELKYFAQYYTYGLNDLSGIRQTLVYSYGFTKKLSIELQVFSGSGRGKDISSNFGKDFVLLSKGNEGNVPSFLNPYNEYYEGIYSYKRISNGLKQDNGWGISLNYDLLDNSKLKIDFSLGYLVYNTKAIIRDNIINVEITSPTDLTVKDYQISYPASIYMDFDDGATFSRINCAYNIKNRISVGLNANFNYSLWNSGLDIGLGTGLIYNLN